MLIPVSFCYKRLRIKAGFFLPCLVIEMNMLIRQIRSFGNRSKTYGEHAEHLSVRSCSRVSMAEFFTSVLVHLFERMGARWPEVVFEVPTYCIGGSNFSSTPQGGYHTTKKMKDLLIMILAFGRYQLIGNSLFSPPCSGKPNDKFTMMHCQYQPALFFSDPRVLFHN